MSPRAVRVAVVNDYALVVAGTSRVLEPFSDRVQVVELDSRMPVASEVDVILYDTFSLPRGAAMAPLELIADSEARFVVFSWITDGAQVQASKDQGAHGFVSKSANAEEIVDAIERVHRGEKVFPAEREDDLPQQGSGVDTGPDQGDDFGRWPGDEFGLSAREAEVLALICQGLSNQEIGERAYIGVNTVKTYIRSLYRKIEATTRAQAVIWGMSHGFEPDKVRIIAEDTPGSGTPIVTVR